MRDSGSEEYHGVDASRITETLRRVANHWGAELPEDVADARQEFILPLSAGIRLGAARLRVRVPSAGGRIEWEVLSYEYRTHRSAVVVLAMGAIGGLVSAAWPFVPRLQPAAPLGLVLLIAAWLLVAARVKYRGVEQFWDEVEEELRGATAE